MNCKKIRLLTTLLIGVVTWLSCDHAQNPVQPNPNDNLTTVPQIDIPWPGLTDSPWPMHHHDPQSTGRSIYRGPQRGEIKWRYPVGAPIGTSAVIGSDATLYFSSSYEKISEHEQSAFLYALNLAGALKWKFKGTNITASIGCAPLVAHDGTIYFGSSDHRLYAVHPNGETKWIFEAADEINLAGINIGLDGVIYLVDGSAHLYAVNPDGTLRWKSAAQHSFIDWTNAGISLAPDGATLYVGLLGISGNEAMTGLAAVGTDGQVRWTFKSGVAVGTPLVDNQGNIYFAGGLGLGTKDEKQTGIFSVTPAGQLRWSYAGAYINGVDLTLDSNGNVYFGIAKSGVESWLVSVDNAGKLRWELDLSQLGFINSSLVCDVDGTVYAAARARNLLFAVSADGKLLWQREIGPVGEVSLALADGLLFVGTWYFQNSPPGKEFLCIE